MSDTLSHWIDGQAVAGASGRMGDVFNPAIGEKIAEVPLASVEEVNKAVASAHAAFADWSAAPPIRRARVMFKFKELIEANMDEFAAIVTREHGKVLSDAAGSITRGLEVLEFACGIPHLVKGEFSEAVGTGVDSYSMRQPLGVVAGITPFNFPAMVPMWMFPISLACGNTFILKPSEKDPSAANFMAELLKQAGCPDGVFSVVHGDKVAVDAILEHPDVAAVSFVGSTPIAEYIYSTGCAHGKRVQALGGAKNHAVVLPDADLDMTSDALVSAAYGSAGERCMAVSVAVAVGDAAGDALIEALRPKIEQIKVGPGTDKDSEMGPLVSKVHLDKVRGYIDHGVSEGAELVMDGRGLTLQGYENGYYVGPCLFDRVTPEMKIYKEEIFGPVLSVVRAPDYDAAIKMVNDHEFGNGVAIFTRDGDAARDFASNVQIGMVGVNVPIPVPVAYHSFGGWKRSLFGDHNMHGMEGVRFNTKVKTITSRWPTGIRSGVDLSFPMMG
ncbi:MAG: CoA-acylating methylmalonate-semialdehyde dehydrogenase [Rhodospirillaceae bacterium]|nr:CoA-acylating methylmalonate-semialdehyde dehydrogenase [Rhodospirillaceae bacterium]MBT5037911.1 CoA-acylating methylmalonate-semialdehyde dehydrogenase [Rhodospirillaceae bacterium]MBT5676884.1 CoA-acylating methylmalonate-semialdehyde dehydrogenase [Rhodospirillaceae bacterium]MBT5778240.1 CoA-acylating methylmalonate-semialdehyde dehydrogenase [Rhodospirillaceae bacterium]